MNDKKIPTGARHVLYGGIARAATCSAAPPADQSWSRAAREKL